jgi:hypothetical protein
MSSGKRSSAARSPADTAKNAPAAGKTKKSRVSSPAATEGGGLGGLSKGKSSSKVSGRKGVGVSVKSKGLNPAGRKDSGWPPLSKDNTIYDEWMAGESAGHEVGNFSDGGGSATSDDDQVSDQDSEPLADLLDRARKYQAGKGPSRLEEEGEEEEPAAEEEGGKGGERFHFRNHPMSSDDEGLEVEEGAEQMGEEGAGQKGRATGCKAYTVKENWAYLAAVDRHGAFDKKPSDPCWPLVAQDVATAIGASAPRKAAQSYDHWVAMKGAGKSGISALSSAGVPMWKHSDSPEKRRGIQIQYFTALFMEVTTTKKAAYKSPSWWSHDLLKDLWIFFRKIRKAQPVVVPQQGAAQVQKAVKEKKTKLAADKEARADEVRKVKDRLAQEQEDAMKQKAAFTQGQIDSNLQISQLAASLTSMATTFASAAPPAEVLTALEARIDTKIKESANETHALLRELLAKK